jgi:hypothetical protein
VVEASTVCTVVGIDPDTLYQEVEGGSDWCFLLKIITTRAHNGIYYEMK